jgi:hypothetical protein
LLLGWTEVATIRVDHLSEAQIRAFRIADNRLTENSTWNQRLLGEQLKFLAESDLDFSIEVTGFETSEIDMYIEGLAEEQEENDPADTLPEIQTAPLVTCGRPVPTRQQCGRLRRCAGRIFIQTADAGRTGHDGVR